MLSYQEIINKIDQLEEANILVSALELRIFSILDKRWMSVSAISRVAMTQLDGMKMLLNALSAMGVLKKRDDKYKNTQITYKYFCESSPSFKKGTVMLKLENRDEYNQLTKVIRNGRDINSFEGDDDPEFRHLFTYAMHERSELYSDEVAKIITKNPVGNLIDLGCGSGTYSISILKRDKKAKATLMDRTEAIGVVHSIHKENSVYKRLKFICGDLFHNEFGLDYNTVLLFNILHIYNLQENKKLFQKIHKALRKGGRFILFDFFLKQNQIEPYDAALFALTMLLFTKTGKSYTFREVQSLLKDTGFARFKKMDVGYGSSIIEAIKI